METDAAAGKRTLVVKWGRAAARVQFGTSLVVALAMPIAFAVRGHGFACLLPLALVPVAWRHAQRLREGRTAQEFIALLGATGRLLAAYALLFSAGLAASAAAPR